MPATADDARDVPPSMARSSLLRDLPATARGLRTREALVASARKVFEQLGYLDARLIDITTEAGCAAGTFYTYFAGKEEIFAAVLEDVQEDMMHPGMPHVDATDDHIAIIEASNRAYLTAYGRNAKLMELLEQVANINPEFRTLRQARSDAFVRRNARKIAELQERGLADPELDPLLASEALSGMISRMAFSHFVIHTADDERRGSTTLDDLVYTSTRLWANALRLRDT